MNDWGVFFLFLQVHSSPGNEGIIYALSWAPGKTF